MSRTGAQIKASETQAKDIQERINRVEKHFGDLCSSFAAYARKGGRLRDKGDDVARSIRDYADQEQMNKTTKVALKDLSENISAIQDYRETEMKRIENRVVEPLQGYGHQCKHAREKLKVAFIARDKEAKHKKALDKVRFEHPLSLHQIAQVILDKRATGEKKKTLKLAEEEVMESEKNLEREIENFEGKKLHDLKSILGNFVRLELMFHAKALEIYTECFNSLEIINEKEDVMEFFTRMHMDQGRLSKANSEHALQPPPAYTNAKDDKDMQVYTDDSDSDE